MKSAMEGDESTEPCWYYQRGVCRSGANCLFKHVGDVLQNPENVKRLKVTGKDMEPEDDKVYTAIKVALRSAANSESEDTLLKLRTRVAKYCRDATLEIDYAQGLEKAINVFADSFFQKFFHSYGDKPWVQDADMLLILDSGLKELLDPNAVAEVAPDAFEEMIFCAHDRALDEQRCAPALWEAVQQAVQGPKMRSKVYKAFEAARKEASSSLEVVGAKSFATEWINATLLRLQTDSQGYLEGILDKVAATELFTNSLEAGAVPARCLSDDPGPEEGWRIFVTNLVAEGYSEKKAAVPKATKTRGGAIVPTAPTWRRNGTGLGPNMKPPKAVLAVEYSASDAAAAAAEFA